MPTYDLTIVASGLDPDVDDLKARLFEAGCSDVAISVQKGAIMLTFHRQAKSFLHALVGAVDAAQRAGAIVERVEPDHLVSLTDIARRSGVTQAAIYNYSMGKRALHFPYPVARVSTDFPLWDWVAVARWMYRQERLTMADVVRAKLVREANTAVDQGLSRRAGLMQRLQNRAEDRAAAVSSPALAAPFEGGVMSDAAANASRRTGRIRGRAAARGQA